VATLELPGFVNAHSHTFQRALRGRVEERAVIPPERFGLPGRPEKRECAPRPGLFVEQVWVFEECAGDVGRDLLPARTTPPPARILPVLHKPEALRQVGTRVDLQPAGGRLAPAVAGDEGRQEVARDIVDGISGVLATRGDHTDQVTVAAAIGAEREAPGAIRTGQ
jgi:hypothetical protein